jgi:hypothetical protein
MNLKKRIKLLLQSFNKHYNYSSFSEMKFKFPKEVNYGSR